jgi:hypothetical protein
LKKHTISRLKQIEKDSLLSQTKEQILKYNDKLCSQKSEASISAGISLLRSFGRYSSSLGLVSEEIVLSRGGFVSLLVLSLVCLYFVDEFVVFVFF